MSGSDGSGGGNEGGACKVCLDAAAAVLRGGLAAGEAVVQGVQLATYPVKESVHSVSDTVHGWLNPWTVRRPYTNVASFKHG